MDCKLEPSALPKSHNSLGVLLVDSEDFNFLGFYMNYKKEAKSLTFRRVQKSAKPKSHTERIHLKSILGNPTKTTIVRVCSSNHTREPP